MNTSLTAILAAIAVLLGSSAVLAQDGSSAESTEGGTYAEFYSQGMQAYVDGDYQTAVDYFYRAYGMDAKPVVARLIVRSFDFMGACNAADRQREFYRSEHPGQREVELQRCSNPAQVELECGQVDAPVKVDEVVSGRCGQTVALAPGRHVLTSPALDQPATIDVEAGESRTVSLAVDPKKWSPRPGGEHPEKWRERRARQSGDDVDRKDFSVYQSRDGLYRVWVRYDLLKDPDMHSGSDDKPRVLRLCDVDQIYDDAEQNCVPLEPLQIEKVE